MPTLGLLLHGFGYVALLLALGFGQYTVCSLVLLLLMRKGMILYFQLKLHCGFLGTRSFLFYFEFGIS